MALDMERIKFAGKITSIAEDEMSALVNDDEGDRFTSALWDEYVAQGKPKKLVAWLKAELQKHFLFVSKPPVWIEKLTIPRWPFHDGKPMVFIEQVSVPETELTQTKLSAGSELYVFGARQPAADGTGHWGMIYTVVEQVPGL